MSLEIVHYPHPALRHVSKPLRRVDRELRSIVARMFELMYEHEGVGLAANQVALPYRLFVTNAQGDPEMKETECVFINPVLSRAKGHAEGEEGCLSIPEVYAPVTRSEKIRIEAFDLEGNAIEADLDGFFARVVQHETDHLDGTLFIDRLSETQRAEIRDELEEFELDFKSKRETGEALSDAEIAMKLTALEELRT